MWCSFADHHEVVLGEVTILRLDLNEATGRQPRLDHNETSLRRCTLARVTIDDLDTTFAARPCGKRRKRNREHLSVGCANGDGYLDV